MNSERTATLIWLGTLTAGGRRCVLPGAPVPYVLDVRRRCSVQTPRPSTAGARRGNPSAASDGSLGAVALVARRACGCHCAGLHPAAAESALWRRRGVVCGFRSAHRSLVAAALRSRSWIRRVVVDCSGRCLRRLLGLPCALCLWLAATRRAGGSRAPVFLQSGRCDRLSRCSFSARAVRRPDVPAGRGARGPEAAATIGRGCAARAGRTRQLKLKPRIGPTTRVSLVFDALASCARVPRAHDLAHVSVRTLEWAAWSCCCLVPALARLARSLRSGSARRRGRSRRVSPPLVATPLANAISRRRSADDCRASKHARPRGAKRLLAASPSGAATQAHLAVGRSPSGRTDAAEEPHG